MKNFKYILISSIIIFGINFPAHFIYDFIQNDLIGIFFPVNESIFQHMKMIFISYFIFYLILFIARRRFKFENIFLVNLISSIATISLFLLIYIPVYFRFGESMIFNFILLFLTILFGQYISHFILEKENLKVIDLISLILIAIIFFILGYLTFNPVKNFLFWDPEHETYEKVLK